VSGSSQVDVMSTTNIARLATTGSNTFTGSQTISGSLLFNGNTATTIGMNESTLGTAPALTLKGADSPTGTNNEGGTVSISSGLGTGNGATSHIIFSTAPSVGSGTTRQALVEGMRITNNGLVSINKVIASSSNYKFGVSGSAYVNGTNNKGIFITDNATYASVVGLNSAISAYNPIELRASGTDYQLYLNTSGNVLLNTASSLNGARLEVLQTTNSTNTITAHNNQASPYGLMVRYTSYSPNNSDNWFVTCEDSTTTRIKLQSNGGISNYSGNNTNYSDARLKKNIIPLQSYWDKFKAIEIVKFKYNDQTHDDYYIGLIAQQVENVAPEFVDLGEVDKDIPQDGIPIKSIYTEDLHHATIKVLQECMTKIEEQNATITELKERLTAGGL